MVRIDNGSEFISAEFSSMLVEQGIGREFTSVDGPKANGKVERRIAHIESTAMATQREFPNHFPDLEFPEKAVDYGKIWPEA